MNLQILLLILLGCSWNALAQSLIPSGFEAWPVPIEKRISPGSFTRDLANRTIKLVGCHNEFVSAQLASRNNKASRLAYTTTTLRGTKGDEIPGDAIKVRFGAYLPVDEAGEYTADPLLESTTQILAANQVQPIWITLHIPKTMKADKYHGTLNLSADEHSLEFALEVEV